VRQIFGFIEGPYLHAPTPLTFELRPSLPAAFMVPGREYWLTNLPYRGSRLSLGYLVTGGDALTILIAANVPRRGGVVEARTKREQISDGVRESDEIGGRNGEVYIVELRPDS